MLDGTGLPAGLLEDVVPVVEVVPVTLPPSQPPFRLLLGDRQFCIRPDQKVETAWVDIDLCKLGSRVIMTPEAVEKKFREAISLGECQAWPPVVGHWEGARFSVDDGRHEYCGRLQAGKTHLFVCWLVAANLA